MNLAELYAKISANFWKAEQIAGWAQHTFHRKSIHRQTRSSAGGSLPIITDSDGYIDPSFAEDGSITNAKLANMAQNTIKGRITASSGAPEDLTATQVRTIINVEDGADVTDAGNVGSSIHGATAKTTPVDADTMPLIDSAASNVLKKVTWANIKATLKSYFDTLYNLYTHPNHTGDVTSVGDGATTIANDAVTNAKAANMAAATIKGRASGAGTGDPTDLTGAQVAAIVQSSVDHGSLAGLADDDHPQYVKDTGDTITGNLTVGDGSGSEALIINGGAGAARQLVFRSNGSTRWNIFTNSDAESGSNAGSSLVIRAASDAGATLEDVLTITRSNGNIAHLGDFTTQALTASSATVSGAVSVGDDLTVTGVLETGGGTENVLIYQDSTTGALPPLRLRQNDVSEEFIDFTTTVGAGNSVDTAAVGTYYGKLRVAVNGTFKYIPLYNS